MSLPHKAAAQNPFAGTWKLDQEKSQLAGDTLKFGPAQEDSIELVTGAMTYSFRTDGNNYAMPSGNLAIWRQTAPDSWTTEYRTRTGKLLSNDSWKLSADGKGLSLVSSGAKATGDLYTDTTEYVRTDGSGESLIGSWKSTAVKLSSPNDLVIQESGLDAFLAENSRLAGQLPGDAGRERGGCPGTGHSDGAAYFAYPNRALRLSAGAEVERRHSSLLDLHHSERWQNHD